MSSSGTTGAALAHAYWAGVVQPLLTARFKDLQPAAGRLGPGSDVLGLDDATSQDHDWGLRLSLFVPDDAVRAVDAELERALPATFLGLPTRFAFTGGTAALHRVEVTTVSAFMRTGLGFDPRPGPSATDWLSLTGQSILEATGGPVFADPDGELGAVRQALEWYPDDLWRYVLACDWTRITQELPLMGRAGDVGDQIGARVIAARIGRTVLHLTYLLERRWPPYAKWFGTVFRTLGSSDAVGPAVGRLLAAPDTLGRNRAVAAALDVLLQQQRALGLVEGSSATIPFWDRPHLQVDPAVVPQLLGPITDPDVRALPPGRGSVEQRSDDAGLLTDPAARRTAVACGTC